MVLMITGDVQSGSNNVCNGKAAAWDVREEGGRQTG